MKPNLSRLDANRALLTELFTRQPFTRHAFVVEGKRRPICEVGDFTTSERPVADFVPWVVEAYRHWVEVSEAAGDDSIPIAAPMTGTHIYAVCFGARPHLYTDNNPYAEPCVANADEADRLPEPRLESCRPLMRVMELAAAVRRELGPDVTLGPPDMQTGFDTACILWDKSDLFLSMVERPEAVKRLAGKCARLLTGFIAAYRREFPNSTFAHCPNVWTPPGAGPWVSNDECGIMSPEMFEEFCLPELVELSRTFGGVGMHCCANAQHQFALLRRIPNFYAFNRVPTGVGWEKDNALDVLGGPEGPVQVPLGMAPADIALLLSKAPPGTRFVFQSGPMNSVSDARRWYDSARAVAEKARGAEFEVNDAVAGRTYSTAAGPRTCLWLKPGAKACTLVAEAPPAVILHATDGSLPPRDDHGRLRINFDALAPEAMPTLVGGTPLQLGETIRFGEMIRRHSTPYVQQWRVSRVCPGAGRLDGLAHPPDLAALSFERVDFDSPFANVYSRFRSVQGDSLLYFAATMRCDETMTVELRLGYDGPVKVWVDGREVFHDPNGTNPAIADAQTISLAAPAGDHRVLIALGSNSGKAWGLFCRAERMGPGEAIRLAFAAALNVEGHDE